jgi:N-methylhydantoinase B
VDRTRGPVAEPIAGASRGGRPIGVDPITVEVVRNRLDVIADEMELTLLKSSYSSIVKEALDASAAIFDRDARTLAQAASLPAQLGMLMSATRRIRQVFADADMAEGDIYIMNDPYHGGTHLPDIVVLMPVFFEGTLVALSGSLSHHQDVGGKAPGSTPPDAQEIFAEGLRIPPMKLYDRGRPNATLLDLLALNVRTPDLALGDLRAQIACATVGARRIRQLYAEYGYATVGACIEELMNYAERMTRARLAEMPDGVYTFHDYVDDAGALHDRPVKIQVTLTLAGSDLTVDFTGSDPAVPTAINSVPASTNAMIYYVLRAVTDPRLPNNEGCYRPLTIILPEGSIVNPRPPHAVSCRTITCKRIVDALLGAFAQIVPHKVHAACNGQLAALILGGIDPRNGRSWVTNCGCPTAGGQGARPTKDGIDVIDTDMSNLMNQPVEATEMESPLRIHHIRLWTDSGGAGRTRGGLGADSEVELLRGTAIASHRRDRQKMGPWGLFGGLAGPPCRTVLRRPDGGERRLHSKEVLNVEAGARLTVQTTGGGGYGDPLERPAAWVLDDVLDGRVSAGAAREQYGVVLAADGEAVDEAATRALRAAKAAARGRITWVFDRGPEFTEQTGEPARQ